MERNRLTPQEEDKQIIDQYILLTTLIEILEVDLKLLIATPFKLQSAYVSLLEKALADCRKDLVVLKADMRKAGIKVFDRTRDGEFTSWRYLCRGFDGEMKKWIYALRNQTSDKLLTYMDREK